MKLLRNIAAGITTLLREISDQNAYARYLAARGLEHSGEQWRRFSDERFRAKYRKAKCC